ncbi:MAG TPA: ankyrin repeat domain-containing protein [Phycisphaerales bacterium]|nr:ankyrin repeat domain-containing protein [Phycisphaerales bacterium]
MSHVNQSVSGFELLSPVCRSLRSGKARRALRFIDELDRDALRQIQPDRLVERPILLALSHGFESVAQRLVECGLRPNLWEAAALDLCDEVHTIAVGALDRLNVCNRDGWSPMHLACYAGAMRSLSVLIEYGADPCVVSCNSALMTPLHIAVRRDDVGLVRTLLDAGADARHPDAANRKPLQLAIELPAPSAGQALIEASV